VTVGEIDNVEPGDYLILAKTTVEGRASDGDEPARATTIGHVECSLRGEPGDSGTDDDTAETRLWGGATTATLAMHVTATLSVGEKVPLRCRFDGTGEAKPVNARETKVILLELGSADRLPLD